MEIIVNGDLCILPSVLLMTRRRWRMVRMMIVMMVVVMVVVKMKKKLAKLRRHANRVHFASNSFGPIH